MGSSGPFKESKYGGTTLKLNKKIVIDFIFSDHGAIHPGNDEKWTTEMKENDHAKLTRWTRCSGSLITKKGSQK